MHAKEVTVPRHVTLRKFTEIAKCLSDIMTEFYPSSYPC